MPHFVTRSGASLCGLRDISLSGWRKMFGRERIEKKNPQQIIAMRKAGLVVGRTLEKLAEAVKPGVTTRELDDFAREYILSQNAVPSFPLVPGYRHTLCVSVGCEIVHGIPGDRVLQEGELVSIDCGAAVDGWHGDSAISIIVGGDDAAEPEVKNLLDDTSRSLWSGIAAMVPGNRVGDIGGAVEESLEKSALHRKIGEYGIVEDYEGHGIGREMHMSPGVPNFRPAKLGPKLTVGTTLAIEPMVTLGAPDNKVLDDDWTVVTIDGSIAAHVEHTVAITSEGIWVLTALDGGLEICAATGAQFGPLA
ncbi:type I methionyl aminopeptidase [Dermatophilus congolensis]